MAREILLLEGLRDANRKLWWRSFPFHVGLYLLAATVGLLAVAAPVRVVATLSAGWPLLHAAYRVTGTTGLVLLLVGAAGLLHRRLTDPALGPYTTPADIFNLLFFLASAGLLAAGALTRPAGSPGFADIVVGLLTFDTSVRVPPLLAAGVCVSAVLVAYIPLTHMSHFVAKWFTYHAVRWDDAPAHGDRRLAARMAENLAYRPTWSAPHVGADVRRSWAEVATTNPAQGAQR